MGITNYIYDNIITSFASNKFLSVVIRCSQSINRQIWKKIRIDFKEYNLKRRVELNLIRNYWLFPEKETIQRGSKMRYRNRYSMQWWKQAIHVDLGISSIYPYTSDTMSLKELQLLRDWVYSPFTRRNIVGINVTLLKSCKPEFYRCSWITIWST